MPSRPLHHRRPPRSTPTRRRARTALTLAGCLAALGLGTGTPGALAAQPPVGLGTAAPFAVLAGSTITNTGPSTLNGDLGLAPGTAITGFPPGTVNGTVHDADAVAGQAQSDLTVAYDDAAGRGPALAVSGDLGGLALTPGAYRSGSSLGLTGTLTLDAQGNPDAVFVFQVGSALTTASGSRVTLVNGAQACNVFWQIGSSATLGTSSRFAGDILALSSISINDDVTVAGRALARNGAVTLINDTITPARCATPSGGTVPGATIPGGSPTGGGTTPGGSPTASNGTAVLTTTPRSVGSPVTPSPPGATGRCVRGTFQATVTGLFIRRVAFALDGQVFSVQRRAPWVTRVSSGEGRHRLTARVTFSDGTPAATLRLRYRECGARARVLPRRPRTPGGFTG